MRTIDDENFAGLKTQLEFEFIELMHDLDLDGMTEFANTSIQRFRTLVVDGNEAHLLEEAEWELEVLFANIRLEMEAVEQRLVSSTSLSDLDAAQSHMRQIIDLWHEVLDVMDRVDEFEEQRDDPPLKP